MSWIKETFNCFTTRVCNMTLRNLEFVPDHLKTQEMCNEAVHINPLLLTYVSDHFNTEEMCKEAVTNKAYTLRYVLDYLKTQEVCEKAVEEDPWELKDVPYYYQTEKMWEEVVEKNPWYLGHVPNQYKTEEMCNKAVVCIAPCKQGLVPDVHFKALMEQRIEMCLYLFIKVCLWSKAMFINVCF